MLKNREKGENYMNRRHMFLMLAFAMAFLIVAGSVSAQNGPKTGTMLIHIYANPDVENADLDPSVGILDINDWPLSSTWINKWVKMPDKIALREYTEMGMMEFDLNNQEWPTGHSAAHGGYYDPNCPRCIAATHFRRAIAHLTDKDKIISDILKGYGYRLEVPLPPGLSQYVWPDLVPYEYSRAAALDELAAGNFTKKADGWYWHNFQTGEDEKLPPLKIYIRMDDPNRMTAGEYLVDELKAIGFPDDQLDVHITERTVCYQMVMVLYDYHIYTGGWSLGADPDNLYDLYHSYFYIGWGAPEVGWAPNYPGFCNHDYDSWAEKVKFAPDEESLLYACWNATKIFHEMEPIVSLWSSAAIKAYKVGWEGVVNFDGYGIDNYWTFLRMYKPGDDTIDYGFKSEPEELHVIASQWLWDWNVIGMVYDSLLGRNPYSLPTFEPILASDYSVGTWDMGGGKQGTEINFTIRTGVKWHDGVDFTADDVVFSFLFTKACGAGVAWNYALVKDLNTTFIAPDDPNKVVVRYNVISVFAVSWAGGVPIIPKHIWEARFPNWNTPDFNPAKVRAYHPWEVKMDKLVPGTTDEYLTEMIGTGPWIFPYGGWTTGESIKLYANSNYYLTQEEVDNFILDSFYTFKGDVSYKCISTDIGRISGIDVGLIRLHWSETGSGLCADINGDGVVDDLDLGTVEWNFGLVAG